MDVGLSMIKQHFCDILYHRNIDCWQPLIDIRVRYFGWTRSTIFPWYITYRILVAFNVYKG